jgi:transposase InsO family protein
MCKVFQVSRSGFYEYREGSVGKRAQENKNLLMLIQDVHQKSKQRYGSPRIYETLKAKKVAVSRPRVARLMKQAQLRVRMKRKFKATTDSKHQYAVSENLLNRNFTATATLKMAIKNRPVTQPLIFHSDRGGQYACEEFRKELKIYPSMKQSMSRKGNCWDNAVAESFFKTLKTEGVYGSHFENQQVAAREIFEFIEIWYNRERLHSHLGYRTPAQMEELLHHQSLAA